MKKRVTILCTAAVLAIVMVSTGCTKKDTQVNSSAPSSEVVSSEIPKAESGQLNTVYEAVLSGIFGEESPKFMKSEDTAQLKELTGIDMTDPCVKEFLYASPMMNVQFQYLVGIEANEGKVSEAEAILTTYQEKVLAEKEAFPYVDFGLEKARGAKVITVDGYVFYVCIANPKTDDDTQVTQEMVDEEILKASTIIEDTLKK